MRYFYSMTVAKDAKLLKTKLVRTALEPIPLLELLILYNNSKT